MSDEPLVETDETTALREDHERLRRAFRESIAQEALLRAQLAARGGSAATPTSGAEERLVAELAQVREDLARVLRSPSWRLGSAATALPRLLRDRRGR